jgi:hypothetical protein
MFETTKQNMWTSHHCSTIFIENACQLRWESHEGDHCGMDVTNFLRTGPERGNGLRAYKTDKSNMQKTWN